MTVVATMIVLDPGDNVGIALRDIASGEAAADREGLSVIAREPIAQGHKIALRPIVEGERISRLGVPVGLAVAPIMQGALVHVHNVRSQYLDNDHDHFE